VPRHFNLFTPQSIADVLSRTGFVLRDVRFSLVPTHWIVSIRYYIERRFGTSRLWKLISPKNPALLALFLPIAAVQRLLRNGGRMSAIAAKAG
jgi:hypothetical protein